MKVLTLEREEVASDIKAPYTQDVQGAVLVCSGQNSTGVTEAGRPLYHCSAEVSPAMEKSMGEEPLRAYRYWLAVKSWLAEHGPVDLIEFPLEGSIGYYLLQNKLLLDEALKDILLVVHCDETALPSPEELGYQFPAYWNNRMQLACLLMADGVVYPGEGEKERLLAAGVDGIRLIERASASNPENIIEALKMAPAQREAFPFSNRRPQTSPPQEIEVGERGLLSIVVPFYNLGPTIGETLASLSAIDYAKTEVIVINDGSTDAASVETLYNELKKYPSVRLLEIENGGLANARNVGAKAAKGEFLTILDADDMIKPDYYSKAVAILERYQNVAYVYPWVEYFEATDGFWITYNTELPYMLLGNMPCGGGTVVRRQFFLAFGQNRPVMKGGLEDYDGWLSMVEQGHLGVCLPKAMYLYRIRKDSMFRSINEKTKLNLYRLLEEGHPGLYQEYAGDIFNLMAANGSPLNWVNPSVEHSTMGFRTAEMVQEMENVQAQLREIHQSTSLFWRVVRWMWSRGGK